MLKILTKIYIENSVALKKKKKKQSREMAQQLDALADLAEDQAIHKTAKQWNIILIPEDLVTSSRLYE